MVHSGVVLCTVLLVSPMGVSRAQGSKAPIPSPADQKKADTEIRIVFKEEFAKKDRESRRALAQKLLAQATDESNTPAARYVLLILAREMAGEALAFAVGFAAIDQLDKQYELGRPPITGATYSANLNAQKAAFLQSARKGILGPEDVAAIATAYLELAVLATAARELDDAKTAAEQAGRVARDPAITARANQLAREILLLRAEEEALRKAELVLSATPDDQAANLTVGLYLLFVKKHVDKGLTHVSKGSDAALKEVAQRELQNPVAAEGMSEVAELWLAIAQRDKNPLAKNRYRERALHWFEKAIAVAGGLTRIKIEKRVKEAELKGSRSRLVVFRTPEDARLFIDSGGRWRIEGGELVGTCAGDREWATFRTAYTSISQVTLRARIVPPAKNNLRIWIGPIHLVFNHEHGDQNHYRNGSANKIVRPAALTPGKEHEVVVCQDGKKVRVTVDGKMEFETEASLAGTISIQAAHGTTIGLRELSIDGTPDLLKPVMPEKRACP